MRVADFTCIKFHFFKNVGQICKMLKCKMLICAHLKGWVHGVILLSYALFWFLFQNIIQSKKTFKKFRKCSFILFSGNLSKNIGISV